MFSGVTDIYQPAERQFELTRRCLEVFLDFRNPVSLITKNYLVTRDIDLLRELAAWDCVSVALSITTLDEKLRRLMEPRTSAPGRRLKAVEMLASAGIPVGVMTAPVIPGLTDHEIPGLVQAAADAGAGWVGFNIVHLPYGVKDLFLDWLERHYPERKNKVVGRIKALRGGRLNDPRFGYRMTGEGIFAEQIAQLHKAACKQAGLPRPGRKLTTEHFRVPGRAVQAGLFE
jgi:DNA repair photolyase